MIPMTTVGIVIIVEGASYFTSKREYLPLVTKEPWTMETKHSNINLIMEAFSKH